MPRDMSEAEKRATDNQSKGCGVGGQDRDARPCTGHFGRTSVRPPCHELGAERCVPRASFFIPKSTPARASSPCYADAPVRHGRLAEDARLYRAGLFLPEICPRVAALTRCSPRSPRSPPHLDAAARGRCKPDESEVVCVSRRSQGGVGSIKARQSRGSARDPSLVCLLVG
jgi:hypothetical protein